jgi:outer membrane immunogenic protein
MLSFVAAAIGGALCSTAALGQSFHWNWTGFYLGGDVGFAASRSVSSLLASGGTYFTPAQVTIFNTNASDTLAPRGFDASIHAGYNWQLRPFVVGVEVDYGAFRARTSKDIAFGLSPAVSSQLHFDAKTDWLATARIRVGYTYSAALVYLTGGAATTGFNVSANYLDSATAFGSVSTTSSKFGWVIGAGGEFAIAPGWTVRAEYLHVTFGAGTVQGSITNPVNGLNNPIALNVDLSADIVRFGASYKFSWQSEPPPPEPAVVISKY